MPSVPRAVSKVSKTPRRPYEAPRLDPELKILGQYGLKNKREIWRIGLTLSKIRRAARELLKLEDKDPKRLFEGNALIRSVLLSLFFFFFLSRLLFLIVRLSFLGGWSGWVFLMKLVCVSIMSLL